MKTEFDDVVTDKQGNPIQGCEGDTPFECFMANPSGFLELAASLPATIRAEHQIAQMQAFVPNVFDEVVALVDPNGAAGKDAASSASLRQDLYSLFEDLADNGQLDIPIVDPAAVETLLETLSAETYFKGVYGASPANDNGFPTTGKLLGIDLGGALIKADDGVLTVTGFFPPLADGQDSSNHDGLSFEAVIDATESSDGSTRSYPRAGVSFAFSNDGGDAELTSLVSLLDLSGLGDDLGRAGEIFAQTGQWLLDGVPAGEVDTELHAYTPGFDPDADVNDPRRALKQTGGIGVTADVELSNSIGFIDGDLNVMLRPDADAANGFAFSGGFTGSANITITDPLLGHTWVAVPFPAVEGTVSESGCVEILIQPDREPVPALTVPIAANFALAHGACAAQIVTHSLVVPEPPGTTERTEQIVVRIDQIPAGAWQAGGIKLLYEAISCVCDRQRQ